MKKGEDGSPKGTVGVDQVCRELYVWPAGVGWTGKVGVRGGSCEEGVCVDLTAFAPVPPPTTLRD